jgi:alkylation response protein AidB-like acyl-CoA dehydrogenase
MDFRFTPEQEQLEKEVYTYLKGNIPPELDDEMITCLEGEGPVFRDFMRQMGRDGWTGIGWPREYGGQGRTPLEQYIFFDLAMGYFRLPIPVLSLMTVGPTLMSVGSEEQKQRFLRPILTGDIQFGIAYTEPEAGTDLFSLKTTALKEGNDYVINGQKIFTSMGTSVDYFWLAARTNQQAKRQHEGISIFLVDAKSPGINIQPMHLMNEYAIAQEFFDNVRVPKECLVGEENLGVLYMVTQLAHERISLVPHSAGVRIIEDTTLWARSAKRNGLRVGDEPWVRNKLAELTVESEVLKILNQRVAWQMTREETPHVESAMIKVFGSEHIIRTVRACQEIMGQFGQLQLGSKWAPVGGWIERLSRIYLLITFGGGTNEVMRDIMARMGLGLMKSR